MRQPPTPQGRTRFPHVNGLKSQRRGVGARYSESLCSGQPSLAANFDEQSEVKLGDAIGILKHVVGLSSQALIWKLLHDPTDATASATDPLQLTAGQDQDVQLIGVLTGDVDGSWVPA